MRIKKKDNVGYRLFVYWALRYKIATNCGEDGEGVPGLVARG